MTLDEAIQHALDVAAESSCAKCSAEHLQLAVWLLQLKIYQDKEKQE